MEATGIARITGAGVMALALTLGGCGSMTRTPPPDVVESPDARLVPACLEVEASDLPTTQPSIEYIAVAAPQLRPLSAGATTRPQASPPAGVRRNAAADAVAALVAAKNGSTQLPRAEDFLNATEVYDYASGVVYTAVCSPGFVTTIALEPGEQVTAITAGDTTRWQLESVQGGAGADGEAAAAMAVASDEARTFVLLKPNKPDCETNLVIVTDRRVYQLDLKSVGEPVYHTQLSWHYPHLGIRRSVGPAAAGASGGGGLGKLDLRRVNFNYLVQRQKGNAAPPWTPLRAFDDGAKTYIQFPPGRLTSEAPPLFVLGMNGDAQVMNYRVKGDYYVVDRLFDRAELRLGQAPQQLVRIVRAEVAR